MNYISTFIAVAEDCKVGHGKVPAGRGPGRTVAQIQYEMLSTHPFTYTQEDVLFESWFARQGLDVDDAEKAELRAAFFSKDQPCLRTSPLARTHGWGLICDAEGRIALCAIDSPDYRGHLEAGDLKVIKAMRTKRG
ncbi:DUF6157 family protein [Actinoplanes utahensis]|uniref:Uncharacterized protein n=1 Tax=Actinoplanes utahensis TaxID=1869 RepID=A0A0A6X4R5_ACTUT|nr:DUF6157 family protein [Actinoplanes utahensis]KHD75097.1 hypothetical protein MB27_24485 [Actinoplanes utahensis]GIF27020.1 hypothetical protein Aut01nite_00060 [Actinoplanes utahensis]